MSLRARHALCFLAVAAFFHLGGSCKSGSGLAITSPDTLVETFSFTASFQLSSAFDPGSAQAFLNGEPMTVSGGPSSFVATVPGGGGGGTVNPGFPLQDDNTFEVRATKTSGTVVTRKRDFQYLPPKARAFEITDPGDLIEGPLADNRVGDFMLANSVARFSVQHPDVRDNEQIAQFGGNLIDAELVANPGLEQFGEFQASPNIETVLNYTSIEIFNDGQDGLPAQVRVCGPDDLLDGINASSQVAQVGATFPPEADDRDIDMTGCTQYELAPLKSYVRVDTLLLNHESSTIRLFVGDYINGMGEFETFSANAFVPEGSTGIGELFVDGGLDFLNYFGIGEATGVDYSFLPREPSGSKPRTSSFTTSGVSFLLYQNSILGLLGGLGGSNFPIGAGGFAVYTRWFGVGDGGGSSGLEMQIDVEGLQSGALSGCVSEAGSGGSVPVPFATIVAGTPSPGPIETVRSTWTADASGCYEGLLPPGDYTLVAGKRGWPYEGGGSVPAEHPVTITSGGTSTQDFALPATGGLEVDVVEVFPDLSTAAVPARVAVVGFDPSPEVELSGSVPGFTLESGLLSDPAKDRIPFGIVHSAYADASGHVEFDLEPGSYQVLVSRGTEYSVHEEPVTVTAGSTASVGAEIARVLDTPGFVSSDFHVHQIESPDSRISLTDRVSQYAGEGVENLVATDHQAHTDMNPRIAALGLTPFLTSTVGEEITTFDYGHFNAYPQTVDPSLPSGGGTDWGQDAPPGEDFPSLGHFNATPAEIEALAKDEPTLTDVAVQVNHIDSHFAPLRIDTSVTPPRSFATNAQALALRLPGDPGDPDGLAQDFFHAFGALELWNGFSRAHLLDEFLNDRIGIWMNLLNQGIATTAIADTDSHEFRNLRSGGARAWTASPTESPPLIDGQDVAGSVNAGRAVGGQGVYVQARLLETNGAGVADFEWGGATELPVTNGELDLEITVQAPLWAPYDEIEIYANADTVVTDSVDGTPTLFTACPLHSLSLGSGDFTRSVVNVVPGEPEMSRFETTVVLRVPDDVPALAALSQDTWIAVVARGNDGVSEPMFPVMPASLDAGSNATLADLLDGNLGEGGVPALGFTNALYADVDGVPGFDAPGVSVAASCP